MQAGCQVHASHRPEPADGRGGRSETGRGGRHDRHRCEEREIVHDHTDHLPVTSRERRYICVASSGRLSRSSTIPRPYSARVLRGSSSTARSYAASAPSSSSTWLRSEEPTSEV